MKAWKKIILLALTNFCGTALAGTISLQSDVELTTAQSTSGIADEIVIDAKIKIKNLGTEAAHWVEPELVPGNQFEDLSKVTKNPQNISPQQEVSWSASLRLKAKNEPGFSKYSTIKLAIPYLIKYQDVNGYKFSIPIHGIYNRGPGADSQNSPGVSENLDGLSLSSEIGPESNDFYALNLKLQNKTDRARKLKAELILPAEIESLSVIPPLEIGAQGEAFLTLQLKNKSALEGSKYRLIFVLSEEILESTGLQLNTKVEVPLLHIKKQMPKFEWRLDYIFMALLGFYAAGGLLLFYRKSMNIKREKK